jgi:two-component system sensor histidine kinase UhpB
MLLDRWYALPVRWQILISISALSVCAVLLSIALAAADSRERVEAEVTSSVELAESSIRDMVRRIVPQAGVLDLQQAIPEQLKYIRHARILANNSAGELVQIAPAQKDGKPERRERAPDWFTRLVAPSDVEMRQIRLLARPAGVGTIVIVGEPGDELAEVWEEVWRRALIWLAITLVTLPLLYFILGRLLKPLVGLAEGMRELEDGHYETRLNRPAVREIAAIADRFNTMAEALEKAHAENGRLYQHMIGLQEDERRQVANELHDEAGPCLFGITANASSITRIAARMPQPGAGEISARVDEIQTVTERLKTINRDLLRRLRPVELGRISLIELIGSLVGGFERRHPDVAFSLTAGPLERTYGEPIDLTVFRCVQEALTNAMRHGRATRVSIELGEEAIPSAAAADATRSDRKLRLRVHDNGGGFARSAAPGIGLTAMRERVRTIQGTTFIDTSPSGTTISLLVPVHTGSDERAPQPQHSLSHA